MRRSDSIPLAVLVLAVAAVVGYAVAAPGPKHMPDAAPDHLTGTLGASLDSPVLYVPTADGPDSVVWLVFRQEFGEEAALAGLEHGAKLTVRGKRGKGGAFAYIVVHQVSKED